MIFLNTYRIVIKVITTVEIYTNNSPISENIVMKADVRFGKQLLINLFFQEAAHVIPFARPFRTKTSVLDISQRWQTSIKSQ